MTLPSLMQAQDLTRIQFQSGDDPMPELRYTEPGTWARAAHGELMAAFYAAVTQVTTVLLGGDDPSTGLWKFTVVPITTQQGSAAADSKAPASFEYTAAATPLATVRTNLIAAALATGKIETAADLATWNRLNSYVTVEAGAALTLKFTAVAPGMKFNVLVTKPSGNTYSLTNVSVPGETKLNCGCYQVIDRTKGTNGFDAKGEPFLRAIADSSDNPADFVGPLFFGVGTEPLEPGDSFRQYGEGSDVSLPKWGQLNAYGEGAVTAVDGPVYIRHTASGDYVTGMVTDAAGAAVGATANLWTGTPTPADNTLFTVDIQFEGKQITLKYKSDGSGADTEIVAGLKVQLALHNAAGGPLHGITATSATTTLVLQGPADGRPFTPSSIGSAGAIGWVETTPEVSTHYMHPRGDKFVGNSAGVGSVPVDVPRAA
jgi:hypothetical protein